MTLPANQSAQRARDQHGRMAAQAESLASLYTAFADDAALHHNLVVAADLDVEAVVYAARAKLHRLVAQTGECDEPKKSRRKER